MDFEGIGIGIHGDWVCRRFKYVHVTPLLEAEDAFSPHLIIILCTLHLVLMESLVDYVLFGVL